MTWIKMRRIKPIIIGVHPSFYDKMELIRKSYQKEGVKLSQVQLTNIIGKKIRIPKVNLFINGGNNDKKKRRPY